MSGIYFIINKTLKFIEISKERNENDKKEISYSKLDDFISGNADSDLEQGWLKNSVLDLAENIFDKVDFDMFKMNFSQPEPFENSGQNSDKQDSQFFIHSLNYNINELMPKENKSNHEILGYTKTILNVFLNLFFKKTID